MRKNKVYQEVINHWDVTFMLFKYMDSEAIDVVHIDNRILTEKEDIKAYVNYKSDVFRKQKKDRFDSPKRALIDLYLDDKKAVVSYVKPPENMIRKYIYKKSPKSPYGGEFEQVLKAQNK
jgi:hypothetical protein